MQPLLLIQAGANGLRDLSSRGRTLKSDSSKVVVIDGHTYYDLSGVTQIKLEPDVRMHSSTWTIDMWVYVPANYDNYAYLFTLSNDINYTIGSIVAIRETGVVFAQYGIGSDQVAINNTANPLPYLSRILVTFTYNNGTIKLYFNGVLQSSATGSVADYTNVRPAFGYDPRNPARSSKLYVDQFIYWDGVKYTDNFTPEYVSYDQQESAANSLPVIKVAVTADWNGVIADKVLIKGVPAERRVSLYYRHNNELVATKWSDAMGNYRFDNLRHNTEYYVLALDHERNYNAVIQDMLRTD